MGSGQAALRGLTDASAGCQLIWDIWGDSGPLHAALLLRQVSPGWGGGVSSRLCQRAKSERAHGGHRVTFTSLSLAKLSFMDELRIRVGEDYKTHTQKV